VICKNSASLTQIFVQHLIGGRSNTTKYISGRITDVPGGIRIRHLTSTSYERYRNNTLATMTAIFFLGGGGVYFYRLMLGYFKIRNGRLIFLPLQLTLSPPVNTAQSNAVETTPFHKDRQGYEPASLNNWFPTIRESSQKTENRLSTDAASYSGRMASSDNVTKTRKLLSLCNFRLSQPEVSNSTVFPIPSVAVIKMVQKRTQNSP
jgi:hypothetical protein